MKLSKMDPKELRVFHFGGYWRKQNDVVRNMMLGFRGTGATVEEYITDEHPEALKCDQELANYGTRSPVWLRWEVLQPAIEQFRPHLLICNAGGLSFRPEISKTLRESKALLGIALSDPDVFSTTRQIAANFDLFLTNAPACLPGYREIGANAHALPWGTNELYFYPGEIRPEYECEVLIFGNAYPDRIEAAQALCRRFKTHVYGIGWEEHGIPTRGLVLDERALSILPSSKMTVVFCRTSGNHVIVKPYLFNFTAAGALVVTNQIPEVEDYFTYGKELIGFTSTENLLEQVDYYLQHPEEAEAIRIACRNRVLRDYTWKQRWLEIIALLSE